MENQLYIKIRGRYISKLILILALLFCLPSLWAQSIADSNIYHLETKEGNTYQGQILEQDSIYLVFKSLSLGKITLKQSEIKKLHIVEIQEMKNGKYWMPNPQSSRYFFSPNGYGLKAGEGYYQNVWVLVNSFAIGITKNVSIGAGVLPLFFFGGGPTPIWLTAKLSFPIEKHHVAFGAGVLAGTVIGEEDMEFAIAYGIATLGNKDNNVSFGLGYGYAGGAWAKSPLINVNFMLRTGAKGYFISENYFIKAGDDSILILSVGGRRIIKEAGLDYGLVIPISAGIGSFVAIP